MSTSGRATCDHSPVAASRKEGRPGEAVLHLEASPKPPSLLSSDRSSSREKGRIGESGCPAMACWSRSVLLWLLAGACGLALLGYCVYFDRKRRNTADFKRRLRESKSRGTESGRPCSLFPALGEKAWLGMPLLGMAGEKKHPGCPKRDR